MVQSLTTADVVPIEVCNLYHFMPGSSVYYLSAIPESFSKVEGCIQGAVKEGCSSIFVPPESDEKSLSALSAFAHEEGLKLITSFTTKQQVSPLLKHFDAFLIRGST